MAQKLTKFDGDTMVQAGFNINGSYKAAWQGLNYQKGVLMFQEDGHTANYDCETTQGEPRIPAVPVRRVPGGRGQLRR